MPDPSLSAVCHAIVKRAPSRVPAETIANLLGYKTYFTMMSELSGQPGHKLGANMSMSFVTM